MNLSGVHVDLSLSYSMKLEYDKLYFKREH